MADHAHDVAAGMQRKGPRLALQLHVVHFVKQPISLPPVAGVVAGDKILPGGKPSTRSRLHVVQRKFSCRQQGRAVLAGIAVAQKNVFP